MSEQQHLRLQNHRLKVFQQAQSTGNVTKTCRPAVAMKSAAHSSTDGSRWQQWYRSKGWKGVSDEFTRKSLVIEAARSFRSERVCGVLQEVMSRRGVPGALRVGKGRSSSLWHYGGYVIATASVPLISSRESHGKPVLPRAFTPGCVMSS